MAAATKRKRAGDDYDALMRHHRSAWRVERIGWTVIGLILTATVLGAFGDGPLSDARRGSSSRLSVSYDRLLRASAPAHYGFEANAAAADNGQLRLRLDRSLLEDIELDSIVPRPAREEAGPGYMEFAFRVSGNAPVKIHLRYRPVTFGRRSGHASLGGRHAVRIDQFVYP